MHTLLAKQYCNWKSFCVIISGLSGQEMNKQYLCLQWSRRRPTSGLSSHACNTHSTRSHRHVQKHAHIHLYTHENWKKKELDIIIKVTIIFNKHRICHYFFKQCWELNQVWCSASELYPQPHNSFNPVKSAALAHLLRLEEEVEDSHEADVTSPFNNPSW